MSKTIEHPNLFLIQSKKILKAEIIPGSLVVSKGQPFQDEIQIEHTEEVVSVLVHSGRKKSKEVAEVFNGKVPEGQGFSTYMGSSGKPNALNFCFQIKLSLEGGKEVTLSIGQGSNLGRNNWWIGPKGSLPGLKATSVQTDLGKAFEHIEKAASIIPPKYLGPVLLVGRKMFKHFGRTVNMVEF